MHESRAPTPEVAAGVAQHPPAQLPGACRPCGCAARDLAVCEMRIAVRRMCPWEGDRRGIE